MEPPFEINEKIPTDLKNILPFLSIVAEKIAALTESREEAFKIKLALEEAITNAMRHGNLLRSSCFVTVEIEGDSEKVILDVHDEGKGFDFKNVPNPTFSENSSKPSGRGIFLMHKLMDSVDFYDGGSGVRMTKVFRPRP
jgi:serine/threonine-protein kinase RsbW